MSDLNTKCLEKDFKINVMAVPIPFSDVRTEAVNETPEATQYNRACQ